MADMLDLRTPVTVFTDGLKRDGVICGRTFEGEPRYNVMVHGVIVKDVTEDNLAKRDAGDGQ
jgi:hypothetical protein